MSSYNAELLFQSIGCARNVNLVLRFCLVTLFSGLVINHLSLSAAEARTDASVQTKLDYDLLPSRQIDDVSDLEALQQVADIEIFYWYGCAACLKVEKRLNEYLANYPELNVRRTPLVAYVDWRPQAYIQPLLEQLEGKVQTPSVEEIYQQCLEDCTFFESYESTLAWLKARYQINEMPVIDEPKIWAAEKMYRQRAKTFSISQVPTIIIKEQYVTDANRAKSTERLIQIVDHLLNR